MTNTVQIGNKSLGIAIALKQKEGWVICFREHHCRFRGMRDFANLFDAVFYKNVKGHYKWLFLQSKTNHGYSKAQVKELHEFSKGVWGYGEVELSDYNTKTGKMEITKFPLKVN